MTPDELAAALECGDLPLGRSRKVLSPLRDERTPSLNVTHAEDGNWLFHDHGDDAASYEDFVDALSNGHREIPAITVRPKRSRANARDNGASRGRVAKYRYLDEQGKHLYTVEKRKRDDGTKEFVALTPDGSVGIAGTRRVLYRLPELIQGVAQGKTVHVVEGEDDADAIYELGGIGTCNPFGAGKWEDEYSEFLRGAEVIIHTDRDPPGMLHTRQVAWSTLPYAASIEIVEAYAGKDVREHLNAGKGLSDFRPAHYIPIPDWEIGTTWPDPLRDEAFHGIAGEFVHTISPHSEADEAALLIQFLVCAGNALGRGPGFTVESTFHGTNLFAVLVGDTSKARKGTSAGHVKRVIAAADATWADCEVTGLSSGEGLIERVRDAKVEAESEDGKMRIREVEAGATDKRLIVFEEEFAQVLSVVARSGSTVSPTLRQAWDGGRLQILVRHNPVVATGAHISVVGHITTEELRRTLTGTEAVNGFANRFLFACVRRSKILPRGGSLTDKALSDVVAHVSKALTRAPRQPLELDAKANGLWAKVYPTLSEGRPGLLGAVTSRSEAQVLRLACIYAVLDQVKVIRVVHLRAALAVWAYCDESCRYIFSDSTGNQDADLILRALRRTYNGLSRTEVSALFSRNKSAREIEIALSLLDQLGKASSLTENTSGRGRKSTRWLAT